MIKSDATVHYTKISPKILVLSVSLVDNLDVNLGGVMPVICILLYQFKLHCL